QLARLSDGGPIDPCVCQPPSELDGGLARLLAMYHLQEDGCKEESSTDLKQRHEFARLEPTYCSSIAFANGFVFGSMGGMPGGSGHEGDEDPQICPYSRGLIFDAQPVSRFEIRSPAEFQEPNWPNCGTIHMEVQWCRWFCGPVIIPKDPTETQYFRDD